MAPVKILPDQAYLKECLDYDPETGILTWKWRPVRHFRRPNIQPRWNTKFAGKLAGSLTQHDKPRHEIGLDGRVYGACRIIWKLMTGEEPIEIDHIDQNPANEAWNNLRKSDHRQNCQNRWRGNKTGLPKGVRPIRNRFSATIFASGRSHFLGIHDTPEAAHEAYKAAAARYFGEFANFGH